MIFHIEKQAKKSGGDKYVCLTDKNFIIYLPQNVSRDDHGQVKEKVSINISQV